MDPDPDEEITALVGDLVQGLCRFPLPKSNNTFFRAANFLHQLRVYQPAPAISDQPTVERLTTLAYEHGLPPTAVRTIVVGLLTKASHLDQASLGALVRNLYPRGGSAGVDAGADTDAGQEEQVLDEVVLAVLGSLGQGEHKPSLPVQSLLLQWIVKVYSIVAGRKAATTLSRAYGVLFNLLDTAGIRPGLCHVLALITRRKHVRPFRIQAILNLSRQTGNDLYLLGLLRVFKNYYPEVIVGEATRGRAAPFKYPDPAWRDRLGEIRLARRQGEKQTNGSLMEDAMHSGFRTKRDDRYLLGGSRRQTAVPLVQTLHAKETSVTLEEIDSVDGLVANLETIELPNQLVAVLADPLLQKLLQLRPTDEVFQRVDSWLKGCVSSAASGDSKEEELVDLVEVVHDYITSTKTFPAVFFVFFKQILAKWDGKTKREMLLESLSYVPVTSFQETYKSTFEPVEVKLLDNSVKSQLDLLAFYTLVLRHWRVSLAGQEQENQEGRVSGELTAFLTHVNQLTLTVVQNAATERVLTTAGLAVLDFYEELVAVLALGPEVLDPVRAPIGLPSALVYSMLFGASAAVTARLYGVLASYKRALETGMAMVPTGQTQKKPLTAAERVRVNQFNGFLMDSCNCLWRGRAFSTVDTNAQGCRVAPALVKRLAGYVQGLDRDLSLATMYTLTFSPTLSRWAVLYLRQLEDEASASGNNPQRRHAGPMTQVSLVQLEASGGLRIGWQEFRTGLLDFLASRGLDGVSELMHNTMKNLMRG